MSLAPYNKFANSFCQLDIMQERKRNRLTMRQWFAYRLQSRSNEAQTLLHSRKLFQQFIVKAYTMVESERLSYIRNNNINHGSIKPSRDLLKNEKEESYVNTTE